MSLGLLVLRVVVGLLFFGHGAQKLFGWFGGHGLSGTGQFFETMGFPQGKRQAFLAGFFEAAGGLLIALGLVTPFAAAALIAVMTVAILKVHAAKGIWAPDGGFEYNAVLVAVVFALSGVGAGNWSLDHALSLNLHGAGWAVGALVAGILGGLVPLAEARLVSSRHDDAHPTTA
ncbi:MAG TPA: DoxX family protein [Thermoleophilaceae bacterium]|jgi:putative oxidoreductase